MSIVKKFRLKSNLTQNQIARLSQLSVRNYQKIENGIHLPRVDRAIAIAKVLNTTVEELFSDDK